MREKFLRFFSACRRKVIRLEELEKVCPGEASYESFATLIAAFVAEGILSEYGGHNRAHRDAMLCLKYKLNPYVLGEDARVLLQREIIEARLHRGLDLSYYYQAGRAVWLKDKAALEKLSVYLKRYGYPTEAATDQERSYQIFGDEKYLLGDGERVLQRLRLKDKLNIVAFPEPLMAAVCPASFGRRTHLHLIVENKAVYYALAEILPDTGFTSLVYGAGWKIAGNVHLLARQLGLADHAHKLYYFGDLDAEGLAIWWAVYQKAGAVPAVPFYEGLMKKDRSYGKENQVLQAEALRAFCAFFAFDGGEALKALLAEGAYYPQEGLEKRELRECWRQVE